MCGLVHVSSLLQTSCCLRRAPTAFAWHILGAAGAWILWLGAWLVVHWAVGCRTLGSFADCWSLRERFRSVGDWLDSYCFLLEQRRQTKPLISFNEPCCRHAMTVRLDPSRAVGGDVVCCFDCSLVVAHTWWDWGFWLAAARSKAVFEEHQKKAWRQNTSNHLWLAHHLPGDYRWTHLCACLSYSSSCLVVSTTRARCPNLIGFQLASNCCTSHWAGLVRALLAPSGIQKGLSLSQAVKQSCYCSFGLQWTCRCFDTKKCQIFFP